MIIGIDLGQKTTGMAISEGQLASPYQTITHKNPKEALTKIVNICDNLSIDKIVIGFVEGKIKTLFTEFAQSLQKKRPHLQIILWDETLSTGQARQSMIKLQVPKMARAKKEHQFAAALILQSYLDSHPK